MKRIFAIAAPVALLAMGANAQDNGALADKVKAEIQVAMEKMKIASVGGGVMGKVVKGAPYSGQEVNESNQVLADGTRIHNETRATVYRDGEGRVRRESGDSVTIWDPVGNVSYTLIPKSMTAIKSPMAPAVFMRQPMMATGASGRGTGAGGGFTTAVTSSAQVLVQDGMIVLTKDGKTEKFPVPAGGNWVSDDGKIHIVARESTDAAGASHVNYSVHASDALTITENGPMRTMPLPAGGVGTGTLTRVPISPDSAIGKALDEAKLKKSIAAGNTQELGDQVIEGVKSRGTRTSQTIDAGAIGNDRPLTTVAERWYSDELQTEILTKRTDPRTGENIFRVININRGEPGLYLFQVPSGYTVNERK